MGEEKEVGVRVQELSSQVSEQPTSLKSSSDESPHTPWPSQPQPLKETKLAQWINIIYDVGLCAAPLVLLTKVTLVFLAARDERHRIDLGGSVNTVANPPSNLTKTLIEFNSQVSSCLASNDESCR
jgi:hypothetical protein